MFVTLFHEIAQELADFIVLTKYGGLSVWNALAFNFLSGLSVCLGGVVFLAANPTDLATGVILAMAGGVYINIAACETAPRMEGAMQVRADRVLMLFSIILGTIPIGLILLDHKHCG
jgi:zinc transporter ZupT